MPRQSHVIHLGDQSVTLIEWAKATGLSYATILMRLRKGWPLVDALTQPSSPRLIEHEGKALTLRQWSDLTGLHVQTIRERIKLGWPEGEAVSTPLLRRHNRGVPCDFPDAQGTGAGSVARDFSEMEISE